MAGYVATGDHLPLSPELTPEVMEARAAFMEKFAEAQVRAEAVHGQVVSGKPDRRVYTADETGYHPSSPQLPLSTELTPEEDMVIVADVLSLRESDTDDMADEDIDMAVVAESEGGTRDGKMGLGEREGTLMPMLKSF